MSRISPRRGMVTPTKSTGIQRDASASSMERALRTLSRTASPPRPKSGRKLKFESRSSSKLSESTATTTKSTSSSNSSSEEAVKVAVRVRPLVPEGDQSAERAWSVATERNAIVEISGGRRESIYFASNNNSSRRGTLGGDSEFAYDRVFGEDANTCEIYNALVSNVVESVTEHGVNGTVFTYGQTCSGKTYTMQGCQNPESSVGIIQLAARDIFQSIKERRSDEIASECSVRVSYVEIYNEELRDLLNDQSRKSSSTTSLIIREDKQGSISVEGLKEVAVESFEQLMEVFMAGEKNKSVGSTKMNDRSSRSHAILSISLERKTTTDLRCDADNKENYEDCSPTSSLVVKTTSTLNLVDLAGSESVRHTNASGMQKKEGGMINQSLLTLSKVLMSLGQRSPGHINYRDSKLTRILKPSLSGNARMVVVCCISPSSKYVEETKSTLQFAARAKLVKTNAVVNEEVEGADVIAKLKMENAKCKMENKKLEEQLREIEMTNNNALAMERKLVNLKNFVFSAAAYQSRDNHMLSSNVVDDDRVISIRREALSPAHSTSDYPSSKDDRCIPQLTSCGSSDVLLHALKVKAKQLKSIQTKPQHPKSGKKRKADKQRRYSLVKLAQSSDDDRRSSLIAEARWLHTERDNVEAQDEGDSLSEIDQLESKLAHAKSLIEGLERQIDDLSLQKNDALDWIEELLAKSDQKEEKLRRSLEERNVAANRCQELEHELLKTKELLRVSDEKFCLDADDANAKIISLKEEIDTLERANAELEVQVLDQENLSCEYDAEKRALIEQIDKYEEELSKANASLKSKSNELDDALFSLDTEQKKWLNERNDLMEKKSSNSVRSHDEINELIRKKDKLLAELDEHDELTETASIERSAEKEKLQHARDIEKIDELMEENNLLATELSRLMNENLDLSRRVVELTDELAEQRQQLINERHGNETENTRLSQKINELTNDMSTIQQQLQDANKREEASVAETTRLSQNMNELTNDMITIQQQLLDANKREEASVVGSEQSRLRNDNLDLSKRVVELTDELSKQRQQLINERHGNETENTRLSQKINELTNDMSTIQQQLLDANKREEASVVEFFKSESEKSKLKSQLNSADAKVKDLSNKIQTMNNELSRHVNANAQHQLSMKTMQERLDVLSSENADLRKENESLHRKHECIENKVRELQCHYARAIAELDAACTARDDLIESNANLLSKSEKIAVERDHLLHEKERIQTELDRVTAEYEAEYESLRSNADILLKEKHDLEDKVVFLEASKASIEENADRILERNNALTRQFESLGVEYKKKSRLNAELLSKVDKIGKRMDCIRLENEQLARDNRTLRELYQRSARF